MTTTIELSTHRRDELVNITEQIRRVVQDAHVQSGVCTLFVPHTTAGITINENADPDVVRDILYELDKMVPHEDGYHHFEGNSAAHIKASMMGFCQQVLIENGQLLLGTWQGIYFAEFDGPRSRRLLVHIS